MAHPIKVVKAAAIETSGGQTKGMVRQNAIVDLSDKMCSLVMYAEAHTSSDIHHHGAQDTIIHAVRGQCTVISEGGKTKQVLGPGDFAFIPAYTEHMEANEGDEEAFVVITRSGPSPVTENLAGWSKE